MNKVKFVKRMVASISLMILFSLSISAKEIDNELSIINSSYQQISIIIATEISCSDNIDYVQLKKDCTVKIETEEKQLEVTFHDVTWFQCVKLQLAAWWNRTLAGLYSSMFKIQAMSDPPARNTSGWFSP